MTANFRSKFTVAVLLTVSMSLAGVELSLAKTAVPLTQCGQSVSGDVYLTADLDCTGVPGFGVEFGGGYSRLEFRGFAIRNAAGAAVQCGGRCALIGPGTIENNGGGAGAVRRLKVSDLVVRNNRGAGLYCGNNRYVGEVVATASRIEANDVGVWAQRRVKLFDTVVTGNDEAGVLVLGEYRRKPNVSGFVCTRGAAYLVGSTVSGNLVAPPVTGCLGFPDYEECADIKTCVQSFADESSTCGTSVGALTGTSWNICSLD